MKVSKESKAERAVEDVESANITESHESTESHENDERIESIERNGQKEKVTGNVNKASESSLVLCEGKGVDNHTEIVQRLVVTIRNRKIVRCLVANAYLAFVPRRAWSACVFNYMRGYWCIESNNSIACLSKITPVTYLSKYIAKGFIPLLKNEIVADARTEKE